MTQKQNDPRNNKQEEAVKDQQETFQETNEQKNASASLEADCQSEAKHQDETSQQGEASQQGKTSQQGFSAEQKEESSSCSPCDSNEKQRAEIGDAVRDEALSAAEKGLEAARAALEAAERKLAEAQQAAYGYSTVAQSSSQDAQGASQSPSDAQQPFAAGEYAPPQGIPQQPATQPFANATNSGEGFSGQTAQGQYAQPAGQQIPVGQQDSYQAPYQQAGEYSYQQPGTAPYQQASYQQAQQTQDQQIPNQQSQSQQAPYQQPGYSQAQQSASSYQYSQQPPVQPHYAPPVASRDHVAAGLLAIFLGFLGIHKFYLGYNTQGFIMLSIALIGGLLSFGLVMGVVWIIGVVEGIVYLTKSQSEFERLYIYNKREWF